MLGQLQHVAGALAQRRQRDREHREAVIEVFAETTLLHGGGEVLVRRGHDPDVHRLVAGGAEATHHAVLQNLEQLGLQRFREEPDLVQEDRAAVRGL